MRLQSDPTFRSALDKYASDEPSRERGLVEAWKSDECLALAANVIAEASFESFAY